MSEENAGGSSSEPVVSGRGTLTQESAEVRRIGALLRGEKPAKDGAGQAPDADMGSGGGGDDRGPSAAPGGVGEGAAGADEAAAVDEDEGEAGAEAGPLTVAELAKTLGVNSGELYKELMVPLSNDVDAPKVSLVELRKGYVEAEKLERERESFEKDSDVRSLEFMQARAELEKLGELIAPHASREVVERLQGVLLQREARERALLLEAVPEWKDAAKFAADRTSMIEFLKPWGFSAADVYAIGDHRIARFVRDMSHEAKRKADAERKARERGNGEVKRSQAPDGRVSVSPLRVRLANIVKAGKSAKTPQAKTDAIGALLRSTQRGK